MPVNHLLSTFLPTHAFSPILTRSFQPPKPDPTGILHIAAEWGISPDEGAEDTIMVSFRDPSHGQLADARGRWATRKTT